MKVRDLQSPWVIAAAARETLARAAARMREYDVGALAVFDGTRLQGVFTERDLLRASVEGADPVWARVGEYLSADPETIEARAEVSEAARAMLALNVRHLPVTEAGRVVGMVSARDLLHAIAGDEIPPKAAARHRWWARLLRKRARRSRRVEVVDRSAA